MLVLRELSIRYGPVIRQTIKDLMLSVLNSATPWERQAITEFYERLQRYDYELERLFIEFADQVEKEYQLFMKNLNGAYNDALPSNIRADYSVVLAKNAGVEATDIMHSNKELDEYMNKKSK